MKLTFFILLFFLLSACGNNTAHYSQNGKVTTIKIESFSNSECLENCNYKSRLISQSIDDNFYRLSFGAHLNCIGKFISNAELKHDTLCLNIKIKPKYDPKYGQVTEEATCNCFFQFDYVFTGLNKLPNEILINGLTFAENYRKEADIKEEEKE